MPEYLLYFNQQWVGDHPEEWFRPRGPLAMAVVNEMRDAGVYVFAGGLEEEDGPVYSADPTSGTLMITDGPYVETKEFLGGFAIVDVPDDDTAKMWAGKVAEACGWPHEILLLIQAAGEWVTPQPEQTGERSFEDRSVDVDGARVVYRIAGEGPVVVLIKNSKRPVDFPVAHFLACGYRTVQVHPVGFGASDRPDSYQFGAIDRQVLAVLDHEGLDDFVVWGFSQTASMAALVARATTRAVALIAGGAELIGHPSDADMRRLEREPRLPLPALEFWRAYRRYDWHHELRVMRQPILVYLGTRDPRIRKLRRLAPTLRGCGCDYLEFDGLDHTTAGLSDGANGGQRTTAAITAWLRANLGDLTVRVTRVGGDRTVYPTISCLCRDRSAGAAW